MVPKMLQMSGKEFLHEWKSEKLSTLTASIGIKREHKGSWSPSSVSTSIKPLLKFWQFAAVEHSRPLTQSQEWTTQQIDA